MVKGVIETYRNAYRDLPREVWLMALTLFVNRCGAMVLPFLALYMTSSLGFSESSAGYMISVYGIGSIVGAYLGGRFCETVGAIRLQTICLFLSVPAYMAIPFFESAVGIGGALLVLSTINEAVRPANATAVAQFCKEHQLTRAFALQRMAVNLGYSFGPAVGGFLAKISFFWIFVGDAVTTFAAAMLVLWFFKMKRYGATEKEADEYQEALKSPFKDTAFLSFLGLLLLMSLVFFQIHATYPLFLRDHFHFDELQIGLLFAVNTVVIVLFEMILVEYVRRFPLLISIGVGCLLSCLGFGILPFGSTAMFAIFSMLILTMGEMCCFPLASGFVAKRSVGANQGMYMGYFTITFSISSVFAPAIGAWFYERDKFLFWYISIFVGVAVFIGFVVLNFQVSKNKLHAAEKGEVTNAAKTIAPSASDQDCAV